MTNPVYYHEYTATELAAYREEPLACNTCLENAGPDVQLIGHYINGKPDLQHPICVKCKEAWHETNKTCPECRAKVHSEVKPPLPPLKERAVNEIKAIAKHAALGSIVASSLSTFYMTVGTVAMVAIGTLLAGLSGGFSAIAAIPHTLFLAEAIKTIALGAISSAVLGGVGAGVTYAVSGYFEINDTDRERRTPAAGLFFGVWGYAISNIIQQAKPTASAGAVLGWMSLAIIGVGLAVIAAAEAKKRWVAAH